MYPCMERVARRGRVWAADADESMIRVRAERTGSSLEKNRSKKNQRSE